MRTSRLGRWVISGALVAAGAVAAIGGQTMVIGALADAVAGESIQADLVPTSERIADSAAPEGSLQTDTWEWG